MMHASTLIALCAFIWLNAACESNCACDDGTYRTGCGCIKDLFLNAYESTHITLEIKADKTTPIDYCRIFKLQSEDLSYKTVSCTESEALSYKTVPFVEDDFMMTVANTERYEALWRTRRSEFLEDIEDSVVHVQFPAAAGNITLAGVFVHPLFYSYFMSLSMSTLFIFTADQNESINSMPGDMSEVNTVNLVTLSWNPLMNPVVGGWPVFLDDVLVSVQTDVVNSDFLNSASEVQLLLDGNKWLNYDHDDMYMVRVNSVIGGCEQAEWLRYAFIDDCYHAKTDNASTVFEFEYAGQGYAKGVDTRIKRAYAFDRTSVWYYEADGPALDAFSVQVHEFDEKQLVSYYRLMWCLIGFAVVVLLCCVCVCCCCCWEDVRAGTETCCRDIRENERNICFSAVSYRAFQPSRLGWLFHGYARACMDQAIPDDLLNLCEQYLMDSDMQDINHIILVKTIQCCICTKWSKPISGLAQTDFEEKLRRHGMLLNCCVAMEEGLTTALERKQVYKYKRLKKIRVI